jgi:L-fuculose-phosphate aldolase
MNNDIIKFGKKVVYSGLATSFFGNISVREESIIYITKTGSMLDELNRDDIVIVDVDNVSSNDKIASTELIVHRRVYKKTNTKAIIHTHSLYSTLMGNTDRYYVEIEGGETLPFLKKVPVVTGKSGSEILSENVSNALMNHQIVIVKDHGVFARGNNLRECYIYLSSLEHYSKYHILKKIML